MPRATADRVHAAATFDAGHWLPGSGVRIRDRQWRVCHVRQHRGVVRLDVETSDRACTFLVPFDRPQTLPVRRITHVRPQEAAARVAGALARAYGARTLASAIDAQITLLPYQLEATLALVEGTRRVLIADEVGLGKTIQAAVAIAEVHRREHLARILLIVPASLRAQWIDELSRRFHLTCLSASRDGLSALTRAGAFGHNPWAQPGIWIASIDFLKQPQVIDAMPPVPWHLVVIDEAHGVCGDSDRYHAAHLIATRSRRLLLLTATPHSGDETRFARLLELGVLAPACDPMTILRRTRRDLAMPIVRRIRWRTVRLSDPERAVLRVLGDYERTIIRSAGTARRDAALLLLSVFRKRALSTMSALAVSLERRMAALQGAEPGEWQPSLLFEDEPIQGDDFADAELGPLAANVGLAPHRELVWLRRVASLAIDASRVDSKVSSVTRLLSRTDEPAIVFTEFRHSLEALHRRLEQVREIAVVHGGLTAAEASHQLTRFKCGQASVLLATDVAGQGLNLQDRSRWVVSLELPWNPARLEQRCGRVDRIGQSRSVHFTLLVAQHEAEGGLLAHLARRTLIARRAVGTDLLQCVPDESDVRAALLTERGRLGIGGSPSTAEVAAEPTVQLSRKWERHGRTAAKQLRRARSLLSCWHAPDRHSPSGCWTTRKETHTLSSGRATLIVLLVPVIDGLGDVLEQRPVAVRVYDDWSVIRRCPQRQKCIRDVAQSAVRPRVARVSRILGQRAAAEIVIERAIASALVGQHIPASQSDQPGLFDRRWHHARLHAEAHVARVSRQMQMRLEQCLSRANVRPGEPAIVAAITA